MRALRTSPLVLLLCVSACGDDSASETSAAGGGGGGTGGSPATTIASSGSGAGSTGSQTGSGGDGGGGVGGGGGDPGAGGGGGAGGEPPVARCGDGVTAAELDQGSWDTRFTIAGFTGPDGFAPAVTDFAVDIDGSVVAAGRFGYFEGQPIAPLMRLRDGAWEPARDEWEIPAPLDGFSAVAIGPDGELALALGDSFGERDGEIWIDRGEGLVSIGAYEGQVRSLAWFGGRLWVAGLFSITGEAVENLATWSEGAWSEAPGGDVDGAVFELTASDDELLVGGVFGSIGGIDATSVASYDGKSWAPYDLPDATAVYALTRTEGGELFAGGWLGDFETASGVMRWTGIEWEIVGGGLGMYQTRGVVTDLVAHGETVDATGCFNSAGGLDGAEDAVLALGLARWTGETWQSLDEGHEGQLAPWFVPNVCGDEGLTAIWDVPKQRLAHAGGRLFAGGFLPGVDGVLSQSIAARDDDATQWSAQGESGLGIGGSIDRIAAGGDGCEVYGIGGFSHAGGEAVSARVVHFDGDGWTALPDALPSDAFCPTLDVSPEGEVAVGCLVFDDDGARGVVLRREGDAMIEAPIDGLDLVFALKWANGSLYVAGGGATGFVGRVDGDTLTVIEDGFDGQVDQLDVTSDDDLVVTGTFQNVGDVAASRIARFTGGAWEPLGEGMPGQVLALARDGSDVYVSSYDEGAGAYLLGRHELGAGGSWTELAGDAGVTPEAFYSFNQIRVIDGGLIASGTAEMADGSGRGVLVYQDGAFTPLGGGVGAIGIGGVAVTGDSVWVAGIIGEAGAGDERVSSVGVARYVLAE